MTKSFRWAVLVGVLSAVPLAHAQFYTLGGYDSPGAVTNNGVVAGYDDSQYFTWTASGGHVYHGGAIPGNGNGGIPRLSADGTKLGATAWNTSTGLSEMASCDLSSNTWTTHGSLGASSDSSASGGFGMNADGSIQVGNAWVDGGNAHAVKYQGGVLTDLGSLYSNRSSRADSISDDGTIIGGYQDMTDGYRAAAVWINGVEQVLMNGADPLGQVNAVSGNGQWAVGGGNYALNGSAYMWNQSTGLKVLDNPFAADGWSLTATAVSADGSVVVGFGEDFWFDRMGWIWTEQTGTVSLESYAQGLNGYNGEFLLGPTAISPDGKYITGYGIDSTGFGYTGWVMHNPVPEPSSIAVIGFGIAFIRRRRKKA